LSTNYRYHEIVKILNNLNTIGEVYLLNFVLSLSRRRFLSGIDKLGRSQFRNFSYISLLDPD